MSHNIPVAYNADNRTVNIGCVTHAGDIKIYVTRNESIDKFSRSDMDFIHKGAEDLLEGIISHAHKFSLVDSEPTLLQSATYNVCNCISNVSNYLCNVNMFFNSDKRLDFFNKKMPDLRTYSLYDISSLLKSASKELEPFSGETAASVIREFNTKTKDLYNFRFLINEESRTASLYIVNEDGNNKLSKKCKFYFKNFMASAPDLEIKFSLEKNEVDLSNRIIIDHIKKNTDYIQFGNLHYGWCNTLSSTSISEDLIK